MSFANENPHFAHIERAPYEIGRLLRKLPVDFSAHEPLTPEGRLIAQAVQSHASNATYTLMHGLEALGDVLSTAGRNQESELSRHSLTGIGELIMHLAVESQFLQELDWNIRDALDADDVGTATAEKSSIAGKNGGAK